MSWRDVGRLAKNWLESEKTELLAADHRRADAAAAERIRTERQLKEAVDREVGYTVLESTLPPDLAARVTAARPENVRARRDAERREQLAAQPTAMVSVTISGELNGAGTFRLPVDVSWPPADDGLPTAFVDLEPPDPVGVGATSLAQLRIAVPHYRGPGRYDLQQMWVRVESGELQEWDLLDTFWRVHEESTDVDPMWAPGLGVGLLDIDETSLRFDLSMGSAAGESRATGTIDWSVA